MMEFSIVTLMVQLILSFLVIIVSIVLMYVGAEMFKEWLFKDERGDKND